MSERALICQNMLNAGQNEVKTFGRSMFKKNQRLSTRESVYPKYHFVF